MSNIFRSIIYIKKGWRECQKILIIKKGNKKYLHNVEVCPRGLIQLLPTFMSKWKILLFFSTVPFFFKKLKEYDSNFVKIWIFNSEIFGKLKKAQETLKIVIVVIFCINVITLILYLSCSCLRQGESFQWGIQCIG